MANVTASVTLQYSPGSGNYPTSGSGYAAVSAYAGDNIVVTVAPYVVNGSNITNGQTPNGNEYVTSSSATSLTGFSAFSAFNSQTITITNVQQSGTISVWCGPTVSGNAVPYRVRVYVTLLTATQSISISGSTSVSPTDTATVTWARTPSGTYYYNSIGTAAVPRALPRSGTLTGTGGSFGITYQAFQTGVTASSRTINYTLRETNTGGNVLVTSTPTVTIYRVPVAPTNLTFSVTSSSITATASGGQYGILQVSIDNSNWYSNGYTFSGLSASTGYTVYARRYNVVTPSSVYTETATTSAAQTTASAPTLNPSVTLGAGGFYIYANPGTSTGTLDYVFTSGASTVNRGTNSNLGVGAATWEGSTWTITVTATEGSTTDTSSANITLPTFTSFTATSAQQGVDSVASITVTNLPTAQTVYYATSGALTTSLTGVSVSSNSNGSAKVNTFNISTSGASTGTANVVLDVSTAGTAQDEVATTSFSITQAPAGGTAPNVPSVTDDDADSASVTVTATATGGSGGTLEYGRNDSASVAPTSWQNNGVFSQNRAHTFFYWARRSTTAVSSAGLEFNPGYKTGLIDTNITIGNISPTSPLATLYSGDVTIAFTGGAAGDQYRIKTNDSSDLANTQNGSNGSFLLQGSPRQHLPPVGETWTYFFTGRRTVTGGSQGNETFANLTTSSITISRGAAVSYSINAPGSVTEGQTLSFSVQVSAGIVTDGTTVPYTITGINAADISSGNLSGNLTITSGTSNTIQLGILSDTTQESDTAVIALSQDSAGNATSAQASITIVDTGDGGTTTSGGSGDYGLEVYNQSDSKVIDPSSRVGTFIDSATYNTASYSSQTFFTDYGVLSSAEFGFITTWDSYGNSASQPPYITRQTAAQGGGILVTRVTTAYSGILSISLVRF